MPIHHSVNECLTYLFVQNVPLALIADIEKAFLMVSLSLSRTMICSDFCGIIKMKLKLRHLHLKGICLASLVAHF